MYNINSFDNLKNMRTRALTSRSQYTSMRGRLFMISTSQTNNTQKTYLGIKMIKRLNCLINFCTLALLQYLRFLYEYI